MCSVKIRDSQNLLLPRVEPLHHRQRFKMVIKVLVIALYIAAGILHDSNCHPVLTTTKGNRPRFQILAPTLALTSPSATIPDVHPKVQSPADYNDGPMPSSAMATPENDEDDLSESSDSDINNIIYFPIHKQMELLLRAFSLMKGTRQLRLQILYDQWRRRHGTSPLFVG